jgi:ubiquinone/menaquinone biosynthesis C-methylase UbiE
MPITFPVSPVSCIAINASFPAPLPKSITTSPCFILANCVLNLVPDKNAVINDIYRVLKPGGHFSISDIVLEGELPKQIKEAAEMYAGCVAGAIQKQVYLELIEVNGFINITVQKDKAIIIPDDILSKYLSADQIETFKQSGTGIRSITVYAEKPAAENKSCSGPDCCN